MDGYNRWMEYPDELLEGSLMKLGDDIVEIIEVIAPKDLDGIFEIRFVNFGDKKLHLSGTLNVDGNRTIETFTRQPS